MQRTMLHLLLVLFSGPHAVPSEAPKFIEKPQKIIWSADHESGDLSQWHAGGGHGGSYDSGHCVRPPHGVSQERAHSGKYSMKMTIDTAQAESGCREFRHEESRSGTSLYYRAWFYIPEIYRAKNYWNIFQFKSEDGKHNDPFWVIDVMPERPSGAMHLVLRWKGAVPGPNSNAHASGTQRFDQNSLRVPVAKWFCLTAYLRQSDSFDGRLTVWQDGVLLWDFTDVTTRYAGGDQRWSVNNYSDELSPTPATIYIDDAVIFER